MHPTFRTILPPAAYPFRIRYRQPLVALGSCFAEHIGRKLRERKFELLLNPFGILYNPAVMADNLERLARADTPFGKQDLTHQQGLWFSWQHHGRFADAEPDRLLDRLNREAAVTREVLARAEVVLLTLGTAHVFRHRQTGRVVANCHKAPAATFERQLLTFDETTRHLRRIVSALRQLHHNPDALHLLWSVSPVRHLRDGLVANQRSKATLLLATHTLTDSDAHCHYFPACELVLDDLRDYRFMEADMAHPNELARRYVWQWFCEVLLDPEALPLMQQVEKIRAAVAHRPLHPGTPAHQQFIRDTLHRIAQLQNQHPWLDFSEEMRSIESQNTD